MDQEYVTSLVDDVLNVGNFLQEVVAINWEVDAFFARGRICCEIYKGINGVETGVWRYEMGNVEVLKTGKRRFTDYLEQCWLSMKAFKLYSRASRRIT